MTDILLGRKLGDYKLESRLTSGGMAHIYMGVDENLGRRAAIKILTPDMGSDDELLTGRFDREARAVAQLEHDNIVTIYQYGKDQDLYFLAMRYIEGNDLSDELKALRKADKLMDVERVLYILGQVADALDFAHSRGIIHRDVKPSNVLLGEKDKAVLSDFGLVLWKSADVTTGTAFGTPRYISPEQATDSASVVPQSDIYSLGVMLYELLTGSPPFTGNTPMEVALAHLTETPVPPRALNTTIPADAQHEILKAMSKEPEDRHERAVDLIQSVKKAYEGVKKSRQDVSEAAATTLAFADDSDGTVSDLLASWDNQKTSAEPPTKKNAAIPRADSPESKETTISMDNLDKRATADYVSSIKSSDKKKRRFPVWLLLAGLLPAGLLLWSVLNNGDVPISPTDDLTMTQSARINHEPTPVLSVVNPSDATVHLLYRDDVFAIMNISEKPLNIADLQLLSETDDERDRFINDSNLGDELAPGDCLVITNRDGRQTDIPEDWNCEPQSQTTMARVLFWRADTLDDSVFRVQSGDELQTRCYTTGRAVRRLDGNECYVDWSQLN